MAFYPYLYFSGTCRDAFTRYQEIFGGELFLMPMSEAPAGEAAVNVEQSHLIMHAALQSGDDLLMASDDPSGTGGPATGISVNYSTPDVEQAKTVFAALSEGGEVTMAMEPTFWSPMFGMCVDRFGIPWMISAESPTDG